MAQETRVMSENGPLRGTGAPLAFVGVLIALVAIVVWRENTAESFTRGIPVGTGSDHGFVTREQLSVLPRTDALLAVQKRLSERDDLCQRVRYIREIKITGGDSTVTYEATIYCQS